MTLKNQNTCHTVAYLAFFIAKSCSLCGFLPMEHSLINLNRNNKIHHHKIYKL